MKPKMTPQRITVLATACAAVAAFGWAASAHSSVREVHISADQFAYSPASIEVQKDDLVKVTFSSVDMAHSFTIDSYRIAKRAGAGQSVVFEFRADQAGRFPLYR